MLRGLLFLWGRSYKDHTLFGGAADINRKHLNEIRRTMCYRILGCQQLRHSTLQCFGLSRKWRYGHNDLISNA